MVVEGTSQSQVIAGLEMRSRELVGVLAITEKVAQLHKRTCSRHKWSVTSTHVHTLLAEIPEHTYFE